MRGSAAFRTSVTPGGALAGPWVRNPLWNAARSVPSLDLRFADNKSLVDATTGQNLVTFTRASSGTYVDSQGVIRTATTNLLLRSEEFDSGSWAKGAASVTANAIVAPDGTLTADKLVEDTATNTHIVQPSPSPSYVTGTTYTYSVFAQAAERTFLALRVSASATFSASFDLSTGVASQATAGTTPSVTNVGNGWYRCAVTFTATATAIGATRIGLMSDATTQSYTGDGTSGIFIWGAQLEQSSTVGEYIPTTSTINSAPRFDHNPTTGESLGLLVEEQRTNSFLQSQNFSTTWTLNAVTLGSSIAAPDGTTTAQKLEETETTAEHRVTQASASGATTAAVTFTVFAKAAERTKIRLAFSNVTSWSGGGGAAVIFDLSAGTASANASTPTAFSITPYPNGWYRCSVTGTPTSSLTPTGSVFLYTTTSTYAGTLGEGLYLWGAQLEAGSSPTSYIPTAGAAATRAASLADLISQAIANNIRSFYVEFRSPAVGTRGVASLNDNTANERASVITIDTDPRLVVVDGGVEQANINGGTAVAGGRSRMAVRIDGNNFAASFNGGAVVRDTSGTLPTVDRLMLGRTQAGEYLNGTIARVVGWREALPDHALQALAL